MSFSENLNLYISKLKCSARELADSSGLSEATISRYRSGVRIPERDSQSLTCLIKGISALAIVKGVHGVDENDVRQMLTDTAENPCADSNRMISNLNTLIKIMNISISELAKSVNYDASYISKIRTGRRKPAKPMELVCGTAEFVIKKFRSPSDREIIAGLINCKLSDLADDKNYAHHISEWLLNGNDSSNQYVTDFLSILDDYGLGEYFSSVKEESEPFAQTSFQPELCRHYYGLEEKKKAQLHFIQTILASDSRESITMYSDMPSSDVFSDKEFLNQYMTGIFKIINKGIKINIIHNLERPFSELMDGICRWLPLYMSGQVEPYCLRGVQNNVFYHHIDVAEDCALLGECIVGYHTHCHYYLTKSRADLPYNKIRAEQLLSKAKPLLSIYRKSDRNSLTAFWKNELKSQRIKYAVFSVPPLYTASPALINRILSQNHISPKLTSVILNSAARQLNMMQEILEHSSVYMELTELTKEEFEKHPVYLSASDLFLETDIPYPYEEYLEHIQLTKDFAQKNPSFYIRTGNSHSFKNMQILIKKGEWVTVARNKGPNIHLVIKYPKLRSSIENMFIPPDFDKLFQEKSK